MHLISSLSPLLYLSRLSSHPLSPHLRSRSIYAGRNTGQCFKCVISHYTKILSIQLIYPILCIYCIMWILLNIAHCICIHSFHLTLSSLLQIYVSLTTTLSSLLSASTTTLRHSLSISIPFFPQSIRLSFFYYFLDFESIFTITDIAPVSMCLTCVCILCARPLHHHHYNHHYHHHHNHHYNNNYYQYRLPLPLPQHINNITTTTTITPITITTFRSITTTTITVDKSIALHYNNHHHLYHRNHHYHHHHITVDTSIALHYDNHHYL